MNQYSSYNQNFGSRNPHILLDSNDQYLSDKHLQRGTEERKGSNEALEQTKSIQSSELVYSIGEASANLNTNIKPPSKFESPSSASPLRPNPILAGQQRHAPKVSTGSIAQSQGGTEGTLQYSASFQQSKNGGYGLDSGITAGANSNRLIHNFLTESGASPSPMRRQFTDNNEENYSVN